MFHAVLDNADNSSLARIMHRFLSRRGESAGLTFASFKAMEEDVDLGGSLFLDHEKSLTVLVFIRQFDADPPTLLRSTPTPSNSISTRSPGFMAIVAPGVPVKMTSPGSSVTNWLM